MPTRFRLRSRRTDASSPDELQRLSDGELIKLVRSGDAAAFEVIYDRHSAIAYSLASRICGAGADAEDVTQAAFLALWRRRELYDPSRGEVRSWLLGIVHNAAIDHTRRRAVHERRRAGGEGMEELVPAPDRTEEEVHAREQALEVRQALSALPDAQRQVIELAYFAGLTHTEIGSRLALPVGTVKGRMRLGLAKLQAALADAEPAATGGTRR